MSGWWEVYEFLAGAGLKILLGGFAFLAGLVFGSFANLVVYRVPAGLSIVRPASSCPDCGHGLKLRDLVPVLSQLFLRSRCRYCGMRFSWSYLIIELGCAVLFVLMLWFSGFSLSALPLSLFGFALLCIAIIDAKTREIPDGLVIFVAVVGVIWVVLTHFGLVEAAPSWYDALLGAVAGFAPLFILDRIVILLHKKDGFGYGDMKLMAAAGLFLGWQGVLTALAFGFLLGAVQVIWLAAKKRAKRGIYIAFGPALCGGTLLALWFGAPLMDFLFRW